MITPEAFEAALNASVQAQIRKLNARPAVEPIEASRLIDQAEAAVRRIDLWGTRGITDVSAEQIVAMACVIAASGAVGQLRARLAAHPVTETAKMEAHDAV